MRPYPRYALGDELDVQGILQEPSVDGIFSQRTSLARQNIFAIFSFPHVEKISTEKESGLARALAVDPEILFFDEPFSALDPLIRRDMQDELCRLQETLQRTIVFITHEAPEAAVQATLQDLRKLDVVRTVTSVLRVIG